MEPQALVQEDRASGLDMAWMWRSPREDGSQGRGTGLTITVGFVGAVLAVSLTVTAQTQVHTLATCTGELGC
jgi:hypothetical protein